MEDNHIKEIFDKFDPGLSSDALFVSRLQQRLDAVEIVREQTVIARRRSYRAIIIAAMAGIVTGSVMTLLFPVICGWLMTQALSLSHIHISVDTIRIITLLLATAITATIAISTYDVTLSLKRNGHQT